MKESESGERELKIFLNFVSDLGTHVLLYHNSSPYCQCFVVSIVGLCMQVYNVLVSMISLWFRVILYFWTVIYGQYKLFIPVFNLQYSGYPSITCLGSTAMFRDPILITMNKSTLCIHRVRMFFIIYSEMDLETVCDCLISV